MACLSHSPGMTNDPEGGLEFRAGGDRVSQAVAAFDPTLVVFFGPDHRRALTTLLPCFTVVESANGYGDWGTPTEAYNVPVELARSLTNFLLNRDIDVAVATHLPIDHGFAMPLVQLLGAVDKVPVLPIVINCIGLPMGPMHRSAALGKAVGDFLRTALPATERVLILASGGLSHSPPPLLAPNSSPKTPDWQEVLALARALVVPAWDIKFMACLESDDWRNTGSMSMDEIAVAGPGAQEVRTWVAAAFAGAQPLRRVAYEPVSKWFTGMGVAASANLI